MKKVLLMTVAALAVFTSPVFAKMAMAERVMAAQATSGCMTENAQISINFNGIEIDVTTIKAKYDAKVAEIEKLMKAANFTKFEMQSMNYNINPQNYGNNSNSTYMFSGSISFTVLPSSKATDVMADLTKKGYQASVNVSAYRNGGMPCTQNQ